MIYSSNTNKQIHIPFLLKIGSGKIVKIGRYLFDKKLLNIVVLFGEGVEELVAKNLYKGLKEYNINLLLKKEVSSIAIEDITTLAFSLPDVDVIVGIGGGKALDVAKYSAFLLKTPYVCVPTLISNDGFCSPSSSITVQGKRCTAKSAIPFGVVIDLDIIADCPKSSFYAGLGDMISKITALWDWKSAFKKGLARYNDFASLIAYNSLEGLFLNDCLDVDSSSFQHNLANSLLMSGIAMEVAGTSRPASGSEHLISHALDAVCSKPLPHGIQVGVATLLCAYLQHNDKLEQIKKILVASGFVGFVAKNPISRKDFLAAVKIAPTIKKGYYTVLSEKGIMAKVRECLDNDELLSKMVTKGEN